MEIITEPLEKALITLKEAWIEFQKDTSNTFIRDSVFQRFEYTFDVDIALDYHGNPVPDTIKSNLTTLFEKSTLPYSVDIIDINSASPVFKTKIEKDFVKIK